MIRLPLLALSLSLLLGACGITPTPSNVKVSEQPAQGLTESAFDEDYLQQLVEETRLAAEARLQEAYERNRVPPAERFSHAQTSGSYELLGGRQLAVINLSYSANPMRVMRVVGIDAERLVTISCISPRGAPLDIHATSGECAEAIIKHFHLD
jgi:hypothetical protein